MLNNGILIYIPNGNPNQDIEAVKLDKMEVETEDKRQKIDVFKSEFDLIKNKSLSTFINVLKLSNRIRNWIRILIEKKIYGTGAYK
jgi:hypothetical protein